MPGVSHPSPPPTCSLTPYSRDLRNDDRSENLNVYLKENGESPKIFLPQLHREEEGEEKEEDSLGYKRPISERKKKKNKTENRKLGSTYLWKPLVTFLKKVTLC